MMDDPWATFRSPKETSDDPWASFRSTPAVTQTPEQATDAMSVPDKFTRAGVKGLTTGASGLVNTLGKSIEGADPKKLAKLQSLIGAIEERMGVDPTQYKPASEVTGDPNRPIMERLASAPRSVLEMAGPAIVGGAVGGLPGAVAATTATTAGSAIDRKREALGLAPDQELPDKAKKEIAAKLGIDATLLAAGGGLTRGLMGPIEATGARALGEAGKRAAMATAVDAGLGADAMAADKVLVEGKMPTASDLVVGAAQGSIPGLAAHAPGVAGRVPGAVGEAGAAAGRAVREPVVNRAFRSMESLDTESRGRVANRIQDFGSNFDAAQKSLLRDVNSAAKGLDEVTRENIDNIKIAFENKTPVKQEWIDQVTQADPVAGRSIEDLMTLGSMRGLEDKALGKSTRGLNPFESFKTRVGDYALAHLISPKLGAAAAILQTGADLGARGIDRFTGLSDPAKVITERYAGTASPTQTIAEARAAAFANDLSGRQAKVGAAKAELDSAKTNQIATRLEGDIGNLATKRVKQLAKDRKAESDRLWKEASASVRALNKRDDLQAQDERRVDSGIRQQADIMRRSQAVEESRLAAEQREQDAAMRRQADLMRNSQRIEDQRVTQEQTQSDAAMARQALIMRNSQRVEDQRLAQEKAASDADMARQATLMRNSQRVEDQRLAAEQKASDQAMRRQADMMRNSQTVEDQRQSRMLSDIGQQLRIMNASESASATPAALPLAVARLKAEYARNAENSPTKPSGYQVDNPGGDWLLDKQRGAFGEGSPSAKKGIRGSATATAGITKALYLPIDKLSILKGVNDESPAPGKVKYDNLKQAVDREGYTNESPIVVSINHKGEAFIEEGNNRVAVARDAGVKKIKAHVYWMNGAEEVLGDWSPQKVARMEPPPEPTYNPEAMEWGPSSSLAGTPAARAITASRALERHNNKVAKDKATTQKKEEALNANATQAKAAKRVKDAEAKTEKARDDADANIHIIKHLGYEIKVEKEKIGDIRAYERKTRQNLDDRRSVIEQAKDMTKDKSVRKLINQLEKDWNTRATNNRDKAYDMLEDLVNDKRMPTDVGSFLFDMWDSVKGTW